MELNAELEPLLSQPIGSGRNEGSRPNRMSELTTTTASPSKSAKNAQLKASGLTRPLSCVSSLFAFPPICAFGFGVTKEYT